MWKTIVAGLIAIVALALLVGYISSRSFHRNAVRLSETLVAEARAMPQTQNPTVPDTLPPPVKRYLDKVLSDNTPNVDVVRLEQSGTIFQNGAWQSFHATQVATTHPLGFVWDARSKAAPLLSAEVVDYYVRGQGGFVGKLAGVIPLMNLSGTPEIDSGELMRYLAEDVWYPTALLPEHGLTWQAIDDTTAEASLTHDDTTVSLTFSFNEADEISEIHGMRYRAVKGTFELTPWHGRFWNYTEINGLRVPLDAEIAWVLPEGEVPYFRGHVENISFEASRTARVPEESI